MTTHAEGTFTLAGFDETTLQAIATPGKLSHATITQEFGGGLAATGTAESLLAYEPDGTAAFVGYQHFDGALDGRRGTFLVRAEGGFDGRIARTEWTVVAGSGTGDLAGLTGAGWSEVATPPGSYALDYEL